MDRLEKQLEDVRAEFVRLGGRAPAPPAAQPVPEMTRVVSAALTGEVSDLMGVVRAMVLSRDRSMEPGRHALKRAIVHVANARGLTQMSGALRALAVEALAWDLRLGASSARAVQDAAEDVAA